MRLSLGVIEIDELYLRSIDLVRRLGIRQNKAIKDRKWPRTHIHPPHQHLITAERRMRGYDRSEYETNGNYHGNPTSLFLTFSPAPMPVAIVRANE